MCSRLQKVDGYRRDDSAWHFRFFDLCSGWVDRCARSTNTHYNAYSIAYSITDTHGYSSRPRT
jgi:hypothetical protein